MPAVFNIGVIGCGNIFPQYIRQLRRVPFLRVAACADADPKRAAARAAEFSIPRACAVRRLLADPRIQLVVNLTIPAAHAAVSLAAIAAGKHVYSEKPLATTLADGRAILAAARRKKVRVGCAPDTFLGPALQTCRKLLDAGRIGEPVGAAAFFLNRGMESWHPDPAFFYRKGAGPMLDVGPYYVTALLHLLGPVRRVSGAARISFPERIIGSQPRKGQRIRVTTPTYIAGTLEFSAGPIATLLATNDVHAAKLPRLEVYGAEGSLSAPDPNLFDGELLLFTSRAGTWSPVPSRRARAIGRGIGVAEMVRAILKHRPHRASGELAYHALEVMLAFEQSSRTGKHVRVRSACERPAAWTGMP